MEVGELVLSRGPPRRNSAYEIRNPLDFRWISDFRLGFWISGFLDFKVDFWISKWISTFWILFEELLFVILKILLINKPSQPGCTQNTMSQALHRSPRHTAYCVHNIASPRPSPIFGRGLGTRLRIQHNSMHA